MKNYAKVNIKTAKGEIPVSAALYILQYRCDDDIVAALYDYAYINGDKYVAQQTNKAFSQDRQRNTGGPVASPGNLPVVNIQKKDGKPTFFIHPSVDVDQEWQVHEEIERLVARQGIQEICKYLTQLSEARKVLLPQNAEKAYNELVRLGMPNGEGYSLKTFQKYYKR